VIVMPVLRCVCRVCRVPDFLEYGCFYGGATVASQTSQLVVLAYQPSSLSSSTSSSSRHVVSRAFPERLPLVVSFCELESGYRGSLIVFAINAGGSPVGR
jgi:hypothetical protein